MFDALLTVWASIPPLSRPFLVLVPIGLVMLVFLNRTPSARAEGPRPRVARWATRKDLRPLLANRPPARGILLGRHDRAWVAVQPTALRRELAHALVVGPPRSGKGLLAVTQLLTWEGSCIVNDLKGELFDLTAGYRSKFSHIVVIDPRGLGQQFDPLAGRTSEDECLAAAVAMLDASHAGKDASDFVQRAAAMLAAIFRAAAIEGVPALLYARQAVRRDLVAVAERLQSLDPSLAVQFLAADPDTKGWQEDRFLRSCWGTLVTRVTPLVTEAAVRTFGGSDFRPSDLYTSTQPVTVYLRWPERNLDALVPLVRLVWDTLLGELIEWWSAASPAERAKASPVLCLVDEAARTPIPAIPEYMATVAGYGISVWVAVQSLAQLETSYGPARAATIRDAADAHVYYRQRDVHTAEALSRRTGPMLVHGRHNGTSQGNASSRSEGYTEREQPLLLPHEVLQLDAEQVIAFAGGTPPARLGRIDWRSDRDLSDLVGQKPPDVPAIPAVIIPDWPAPTKPAAAAASTGRLGRDY
jgi:type IV secretion system protein VirD4